MKIKQLVGNVAVMSCSLLVGLALCEVGARAALNPADYLSVTMEADPVLGIRIAPNSAGFDSWGFRNPSVPSSVDVVALGDSHTFGNTAKMNDAWPRVVAGSTGASVYNMGIGGYGPNQYYHLMKTRALTLHPRRVVCGLYMGDDFENAFSTTYGLESWASRRQGTFGRVNADIWGDDEAPGRLKALRNWLSRNSLVYRLTVHGPVLAGLKQKLQFRAAQGSADPKVTTLEVPAKHIKEAFRPIRVAAGLDQNRPEVREGMRITFQLLKDMDRLCRENGCAFSVVIIPTKETVFADYLKAQTGLHLKQTVGAVIDNERLARAALGQFLDEAGIPYVDALPALRPAVSGELYYRGPADMHPAANGYRVIGNAVASFLKSGAKSSN